jgi:hypothetical protein
MKKHENITSITEGRRVEDADKEKSLLRKPKAANPCKDGAVKRKTRNVM